MVVVEEQQSGTRVDVPASEWLAIRLKENPGTGYRWSVEQADGLTIEESVDRGGAPGAAGMHEFRFRASVPGSHYLSLRHWRDWEGDTSVTSRFALEARFV